jgi:hypothetical protein
MVKTMITIPGHPPIFQKLGYGMDSDAIETSLSYEELLDYLNLNEILPEENEIAKFFTEWYLYYREKYDYRDDYMEYKILTCFSMN